MLGKKDFNKAKHWTSENSFDMNMSLNIAHNQSSQVDVSGSLEQKRFYDKVGQWPGNI